MAKSFIPDRNQLMDAIGALKGTLKNKLMPEENVNSQIPLKEDLPPMTDEEYRIFIEKLKMHRQMQ